MKLAEMEVKDFAAVLASDAPAPGGGSVAGLEGALGAALTSMVSALTVGKKKYADVQEQAEKTGEKARALKDRFVEIMDRDTETFNILSAAFAMPKATDEEKAARSAKIQEGLKLCTKVPYETMELCAEGIDLVAASVGKFNASAASDLGVAALSLKAGMLSAGLNVLINIGSIKDKTFAEEYRAKGEKLLQHALKTADESYQAVLASLE